MYQAFSRRLTAWYVGAAAGGVLLILLAFAFAFVVLYTHLLDESAAGIASAVMAIIVARRSGFSRRRISIAASYPSISGIWQSIKMTS